MKVKKVIGNVIFVEFAQKVLTKGELNKIEKRIEVLSEIIDRCDPDRDADVLANVEMELDMHVETLQKSYDVAKRNERKKGAK